MPSSGVGHEAAARRVATIRRTTNLQRDSAGAIGDPDSDSDTNDASGSDSDAASLNISWNDNLYAARSLQGTNQSRNPQFLSSSLSVLSQDDLVDHMLAGLRTRVFPRSRRDRNSGDSHTSVAVWRAAKQDSLKEDLASSVRVEGSYSRFKVDVTPVRRTYRTPRNRRDHATNICILEHTDNYWKKISRGVKTVSAGVRLIPAMYRLCVVTMIGPSAGSLLFLSKQIIGESCAQIRKSPPD
jgi:hypothetical protein